MIWATTSTVKSSPAASTSRLALKSRRGWVAQITSSGAITRSPAMSPSHQVNHTNQYCSQRAKPPKHKLVTPRQALTAVLNTPASKTNLKMFRARSKTSRPLANRLTSQAPSAASKVLPAAMPSDVAVEPWVVMLTRTAPKKQRRQSQAGGRPDGRGAGVHISEREPELAAAEICRSQGQGLNQEQASGFGGARAQWSL